MPISQDAYVSFRGTQRRVYGEPTDPAPVIFVDLDSDDVELLRSLPPTFVGQRGGIVLVRLPRFLTHDQQRHAALLQLADRWNALRRVAVLHQPVGKPAAITVLRGPAIESNEQEDILRRARATELEALLELGHAIWRPATYHYRLITGEHADAYIKLADAIREPRDAAVLASWLHAGLCADMGLIFDTGTMTPVAQALQAAAIQAELALGPVAMLDNYPRTGVDLDAVIDRVAGDHGRVSVALTISSSGSLLERVLAALARKGPSLEHVGVHVLVAKSGRQVDDVETWTPLPGQDPLVSRGSRDEIGCTLCRQPGRAPLVPINPFSFDAMLPSQLRQIVPDVEDPGANRSLWEAANRAGALEVEREGNAALRRYRSARVAMGIVVRPEKLLANAEFQTELADRVRRAQREQGMSSRTDLVLVPEHEASDEHFPAFWEALGPAIAPAAERPLPFPIDPTVEFGPSLVEAIQRANDVLVFQLGTVSGATLQRALVGVQDARGSLTDFNLHAYVVHLRPATSREWTTIRNSYGYRGKQPQLRCAWKSILPDRSPLRDERALLRNVDASALTPVGQSFLTERLAICSGHYEGSHPKVLWGAGDDARLTPNSIYGQRLDVVSTYVAVGSAMGAALAEPARSVPEFRVFEIAAMARSYYDPIILGCFLRWLRPHEVFWGWTGAEAETTALHIIDRAVDAHRSIILPEMLLAMAQGKLTAEAAKVTEEAARGFATDELPPAVQGALEVGLRLAADSDPFPPTEGVYGPAAESPGGREA